MGLGLCRSMTLVARECLSLVTVSHCDRICVTLPYGPTPMLTVTVWQGICVAIPCRPTIVSHCRVTVSYCDSELDPSQCHSAIYIFRITQCCDSVWPIYIFRHSAVTRCDTAKYIFRHSAVTRCDTVTLYTKYIFHHSAVTWCDRVITPSHSAVTRCDTVTLWRIHTGSECDTVTDTLTVSHFDSELDLCAIGWLQWVGSLKL